MFAVRRRKMHGAQVDDRVADPTNMLVAILLRYPEIASVQICSSPQSVICQLLVRTTLTESDCAAFRRKVNDGLQVFSTLERSSIGILDIQFDVQELTVIEIKRDVATLQPAEFRIWCGLARQAFGEDLVMEAPSGGENVAHEAAIQHGIECMRKSATAKQLVSFRTGSRILVYHRDGARHARAGIEAN